MPVTSSGLQTSAPYLLKGSRAAGLAIIAIAASAVLGWMANFQVLIRVFPTLVGMNPVSALLFVAAGWSLWRLTQIPAGQTDLWRGALGLLICLAGVLKLLDCFLGLGSHFDYLLFPSRIAGHGLYPSSQIAPIAALALLFCGLALLLVDVETRRGIRPAQGFVLATGLIALVALIGYAYRVLLLYRLGGAIPMSLGSAVCLALFCLGFLAARPKEGIMRLITSRTTGGAVARRLLPMAILVPWGLGGLLMIGEQVGYYQRDFEVSIFAVASIVIFTSLIWWNAKLLYRADLEQRRTERRLSAQHSSTRVLAESSNMASAFPKLLESICQALGWRLGALWKRDGQDGRLYCSELWSASNDGLEELISKTRDSTLALGEDLPGRGWAGAQPVWLPDLVHENKLPRTHLAAKAGLHSACSIPIRVGTEVFGVLEFFSPKSEFFDQPLQEMLTSIGTQAGLFIERIRAEEQLRETTANLQRSNTDLQQFAYVASHDLLEPLRMVNSYLDLLSHRYGGAVDARGKEFIGFAMDGARRMAALIHDLLEYSRVDTGGRSFEPIDIEQVLRTALANLKVAIEESGAAVEHGPLPQVMGDPVQLTQLFQNLIGNAVKFRAVEPPRIHIDADRQDGEWRFHVQDNGIGIDPKYFDRIFVLFQRLHTRQEYSGTGIGLALCKKIIERHGGRIGVESAPGKGANFWFTLPAWDEKREPRSFSHEP